MAKAASISKDYTSSPLFRECHPYRNIITNSDMKSGWNVSGSSSPAGKTGGYSITLTGTGNIPEVCVASNISYPLIKTHIYYSRFYAMRGDSSSHSGESVGIYWPIAEPSFYDGFPIVATSAWTMYSYVTGRSSFSSGNYQYRLDYNNIYEPGIMRFSAPMLIDLTEAFGPGLEPDKAWCDAHIPDIPPDTNYVEGELETPFSIQKTSDTTTTHEFQVPHLKELFLPNIVVNGGFEDTTGWSSSGNASRISTDKLYGTYSYKFPAGSSTPLIARFDCGIPVVGHTYYGRHSIKTIGGDPAPADCRFEWFGGDGAGKNFVFGYNTGNRSTWYTESALVTITSVTGSNFCIRSFAVNPKYDIYTDGLMIVDVTNLFGTNKTPTKEWCDKHLWFTDGDIIVTNFTRIQDGNNYITPQLKEV